MDLRPTRDQAELVAVFADLLADHSTPDHVRAAEAGATPGHDPTLWQRLIALGAVDMATAVDDVTLLDLALVAEQLGRFVAPTPMLEVQVATRLLARCGAHDPDRTATLALRPPRDGIATLVPAGAVADDVLVLEGTRLRLLPLAGRVTPVANLADLPLADVTVGRAETRAEIGGGRVVAEGEQAVARFAQALDEWRVLTAAALAGLSIAALENGVEYVKQRKAFGQPVGQFQSVQHRLADRASETDGAQLLAREAAWSHDHEPDRFSALASMSLAFSAETAIATSHDALHFHGGYGFMIEYAAQLYYRRARGWGAVLESPAEGYRRVGTQRLARAGAA